LVEVSAACAPGGATYSVVLSRVQLCSPEIQSAAAPFAT